MSKPATNQIKTVLETAYDTLLKVETEVSTLYEALNDLENHLTECKKLIHRAEQLIDNN
jgi:hypothetical protein